MIAVVRTVSGALERCELTHVERTPISVETARLQHDAYVDALQYLGCRIEWADDLPDAPDAVFVEDTALVLEPVAVILRPGASSRRGETASVARILSGYRPLLFVQGPGTIDGGDLLVIGKTIYVGQSSRSSPEGIRELAGLLQPFGYRVVPVEMHGCLHLKSAATACADDAVVVNPAWVDPSVFDVRTTIEVAPTEPSAANVVRVGSTLLADRAYPETNARLASFGAHILTVDLSELAKAEGAVTCCSILIR